MAPLASSICWFRFISKFLLSYLYVIVDFSGQSTCQVIQQPISYSLFIRSWSGEMQGNSSETEHFLTLRNVERFVLWLHLEETYIVLLENSRHSGMQMKSHWNPEKNGRTVFNRTRGRTSGGVCLRFGIRFLSSILLFFLSRSFLWVCECVCPASGGGGPAGGRGKTNIRRFALPYSAAGLADDIIFPTSASSSSIFCVSYARPDTSASTTAVPTAATSGKRTPNVCVCVCLLKQKSIRRRKRGSNTNQSSLHQHSTQFCVTCLHWYRMLPTRHEIWRGKSTYKRQLVPFLFTWWITCMLSWSEIQSLLRVSCGCFPQAYMFIQPNESVGLWQYRSPLVWKLFYWPTIFQRVFFFSVLSFPVGNHTPALFELPSVFRLGSGGGASVCGRDSALTTKQRAIGDRTRHRFSSRIRIAFFFSRWWIFFWAFVGVVGWCAWVRPQQHWPTPQNGHSSKLTLEMDRVSQISGVIWWIKSHKGVEWHAMTTDVIPLLLWPLRWFCYISLQLGRSSRNVSYYLTLIPSPNLLR